MAESASQPCIASIIIPCYLRADLVHGAVLSAVNQDFEPSQFEVLVVDSSPDDTVRRVVEKVGRVAACRLHYYKKPPEGPGPSRNLGAAKARGEYVAFLDSDCRASSGWLRAALNEFGPGIGIVQGRTLPELDKPQAIFSHTLRIESETFLYETANIVYRRRCFEQSGGFWKDWQPNAVSPLGGEDADLAWRAKSLGWKTAFASSALVYHAILPMAIRSWIWIGRLKVFPALVRRHPELRSCFFSRYFYDKAQALLVLGLLGLALSYYFWPLVLLALPYLWHRGAQTTRTLRGPLRVLRPAAYLLRDVSSLLILTRASLRFRTLFI